MFLNLATRPGEPMSDLEQYRLMADKARLDAESTSLPKVREKHLRSAERLDEMISRIDTIARAKTRNEDAKRDLAGS
jgi:hypothetical protein